MTRSNPISPRKSSGEKAAAAPGLAAALEGFLGALEPSPVNAVRAELARTLVAAVEQAPPYALARLAGALDALLAAIDADDSKKIGDLASQLAWLRRSA